MNLYKYHSKPEVLDGYEDRIYRVPEMALAYAKKRGLRVPEAEEAIMRSPRYSYYYTRDIIRGRWLEAEPVIKKSPFWAYRYSRDVIYRRWTEAEPYIMQEPLWAYWYAKDVIGGRWLEAESYIEQDESVWNDYKRYFNL